MPKVYKNNLAKTLESIVLKFKLGRGVRGGQLACVVQSHIKVPHVLPGYGAFLNIDYEMVGRTFIVNETSSIRFTQDTLDCIYFYH